MIGDQNLMGKEFQMDFNDPPTGEVKSAPLPPDKCVGKVLAATGSLCTPQIEVALDADGYAAHCAVGLSTGQVLKQAKDGTLDLQPDDVAVVCTQLWDPEIRSIKQEGKGDPWWNAKAERVGVDHTELVKELRRQGVLVACGKLLDHPELEVDLSARRGQKKHLETMFTRLEMEHQYRFTCSNNPSIKLNIPDHLFPTSTSSQHIWTMNSKTCTPICTSPRLDK